MSAEKLPEVPCWRDGIMFSNETEGAIDFEECSHPCHCEPRCKICGHRKHTAIHGPAFGKPSGSKPWGHKFVPNDPQ